MKTIEGNYKPGSLDCKSDSVEYVATLINKYDFNKEVGYLIRVLEDMCVPNCGLGRDAKYNCMSYLDRNGTRYAKKGELVQLTKYEMGILLFSEEFNGYISGGGKKAFAEFKFLSIMSMGNSRFQLFLKPSEVNIVNIVEKSDSNGESFYIKKGYEKFKPILGNIEETRAFLQLIERYIH